MPSPSLILAVNVSLLPGRNLVSSNGSVTQLSSLKRALYAVAIYLRQTDPTAAPGVGDGTKAFDMTGWDGIRVGIWKNSPAVDADVLTLTGQEAWTYNQDDEDNPYWAGDLNTLTDQIREWINGAACKDAYFSIALVRGADIQPIYDFRVCGEANIEIQNITDPGSGNSTNMTGQVPRLPLPCELGPDEFGKIWRINGISGNPPTLDIACLNP